MATLSPNLLLILLALGESAFGSFPDWGAVTNDNLSSLEAGLSGQQSVTVNTANVTLTDAQARNLVLNVSGAKTANRALIVPTRRKLYYVVNGASDGFKLTVRTSGGTGVSLEDGQSMFVYCDGVNVVQFSGWVMTSNSDGISMRHPSGIQVCWEDRSPSVNPNNASGNVFYSNQQTWNYPQAFRNNTIPSFAVSVENRDVGFEPQMRWATAGDNVTNTSAPYFQIASKTGADTKTVHLFAIGLW